MRARTEILFAALLAAAMPRIAGAQETCPDDMTVLSCLEAARLAAAGEKTKAEVEAQTAGKPAGEAGAGQVAPTIDDFLPRVAAAALAPGLDSSVVGRLNLNIPLNSEHFNYVPLAMRITGELRNPSVHAAMLDSVAEARRSAVRERMEGKLGEFDDVELTLAFNREDRWWGRRFESHSRELDPVRGTYNTAYDLADILAELAAYLSPHTTLPGCGLAVGTSEYDYPIKCFAEDQRDSVRTLAKAAGNAAAGYETRFDAWAEHSGWKYVPDLLNNQPQLSLHAGWRPLAHSVGPESWSVRVRYERGFVNLNSVRNFCLTEPDRGQPKGYDVDAGQFTAECFRNYMRSRANRDLLRLGIRGFVEGQVTRERHWNAPFEETDSARFRLPSAWRAQVTGGVGGFLPTRAEIQSSRIDLAFTGDWAITEDDLRPDKRLTVTLSLTQRLNQNFSLLSGLVWSDHGEFKDEDVTPVRLNLGVRYKLVPSKPD